ncbi:MAG TPA: hypothetical protein VHC18_05735 [Amycolatopsis sp.]|nr:hypothetical protein [Amycolatopsis sp.]
MDRLGAEHEEVVAASEVVLVVEIEKALGGFAILVGEALGQGLGAR